MKVSQIAAAIEEFAPLSIQEQWDNSGLSVGSPSQEVSGVMIGFDCTPELVDEAVASACNMVVTHHPLSFGGIKRITPEDPVGLTIIKAVRAGVAVYAAHTTADKVPGGVSGAMASRLGLQNISILEPEGDGNYGLGMVGDLPSPLSYEQALALVKSAFGLKMIRASRDPGVPVSRIAMCGGSGQSLMDAARAVGAQLYLCGDVSYHHFFTAPGFAVADIGHFESEVEIVDVLFSHLRKKFPNFAVHVSKALQDSNPIKYI